VRIFKNKWFSRFAKKEGITDDELKYIVSELEKGLWDADLGGGVYTKRVARPGEGKADGYRTIVFFKSGERTFFTFGFPKSKIGNVSQKVLQAYKETAKELLRLFDTQLDELVRDGEYIEIGV
jgi:hypothetical protein